MAIDYLDLRNFKCFGKKKFNFRNVNFLAGINSVGKSSVIQSILASLQSEEDSELEFNGGLVNLGEYEDMLKFDADDDSIYIGMSVNEELCSWGYSEGYVNDNRASMLANLPVIFPPKKEFTDLKESFQYLSAERWGPKDNVPLVRNHRINWLGKYGENTIQFLYFLSNEVQHDKAYALDNEEHRVLKSGSTFQLDVISNWVEAISPGSEFAITGFRNAGIGWINFSSGSDSGKYKATNVGFGLSYVLSVVTALVSAKKGDVVLLENPEAHMHPRGQSLLGQLIARAGEDGVQVIVETHSEHLINGARVAVKKKMLAPENMKVFFFDKAQVGVAVQVTDIFINEFADLSEWPEGFFDQAAVDLLTIIKS